jgi:hypothetical protein
MKERPDDTMRFMASSAGQRLAPTAVFHRYHLDLLRCPNPLGDELTYYRTW